MPELLLGDVRLHYQEQGTGDPVLLLHGLGSSARDWEHQLPALAAHYRVIAVDLRGHGSSERTQGPFSVAQFAGDVAALMDRLQLPTAHLVGISMGGMVGFQLAVDAPARVRSLVAINAGPELVARSLRQHLQLWLRRGVFRLFGLRRVAALLAPRLFPKPEQGPLRETFLLRWLENDPVAYGKAFRMLLGWSVVDRLERLVAPVLLIAGDGDYTPVSSKQAFLAHLPTGRLAVVEDSRHASTVDQPQRVNALLLDFLRQG